MSQTSDTGTTLDLAFGALADPTRRAMLQRLSAGETLTVSELAQPIDMSLPAVMKHLGVLESAGLIVREKRGRTVHCRMDPAPMRDAMSWLEEMETFWTERLDALAKFVEAEEQSEFEAVPPKPPTTTTKKATARVGKRKTARD